MMIKITFIYTVVCLIQVWLTTVTAQKTLEQLVKDNLRNHLNDTFSRPRGLNYADERQKTMEYIGSYFRNLQTKHPTSDTLFEEQALPPLTDSNNNSVAGKNLFLIIKGARWGTPVDQIVLVGTHFDTAGDTPGVNDNGSGMAAMLEIARLFLESTCQRLNTVIIAAFDFGEEGLIGSGEYVDDWLVPWLQNHNIPETRFQGAFIMDTLLNFNSTENSQMMPTGFQSRFPEIYNRVMARESRGDFIVILYRVDYDQALADAFSHSWNELPYSDKFYVETIPIPDTLLGQVGDPRLTSDHARFWKHSGSNYSENGLKALDISDTDQARGFMQTCYHESCDDTRYLTDDNVKFMMMTTLTVTNAVLNMTSQSENCKYKVETGNPVGLAPTFSSSIMTIILCLAFFLFPKRK